MSLIDLAERGTLPDWLIRVGMRRLLARRIRVEGRGGVQLLVQARRQFLLCRALVGNVQQQPDTESDQRDHHARPGGQRSVSNIT